METIVTEKKCTKCKSPRSNKHVSWCESCLRALTKKNYDANPDERRRRSREWNAANPDRHRSNLKKWRKENREHVRSYKRNHYHNGNGRVQALRYYLEHAANIYQRLARWRKANPDKVRAAFHRRRARVKGNGGAFTAQEWRELCEFYGNRCLCCKRSNLMLTPDHVVPLVKGGSNSIDNIQPLCRPCNSRKGTKTIDYRGNYDSR